jgi:hypothetical protein
LHSAAVLAVAQRRKAPKPGEVERALWRDRSIVKTWAMRGTLHLLPADELPNVVATMRTLRPWRASWERYFGVKTAEVEKVREGIGEVLDSGWGQLLKPAAYAGLLINGPPRNGRVTFTRPDTWLGGWSEPDPIEGGAALVRLYLRAHGPARMKDVAAWWARQPTSKVRKWFAALEGELVEVSVEGRRSWMLAPDVESLREQKPNKEVRLLPAFDQYVLAAARDIEALVPAERREEVFRTAGWIAPTVVLGGRVVGTWSTNGRDVESSLWEYVPDRALAAERQRIAREPTCEPGGQRPLDRLRRRVGSWDE